MGIVARSAAAALAALGIAAIWCTSIPGGLFNRFLRWLRPRPAFVWQLEQPVEVTGTTEMRELAVAFNSMAEKLKDTEQVRRDFYCQCVA